MPAHMSEHLQASSLPALRILVVDDQASARCVLAAQLTAAGHPVLWADSGDRALTLFQQDKPDLVSLDVEMPGHDGYWVASQLRASEAGGDYLKGFNDRLGHAEGNICLQRITPLLQETCRRPRDCAARYGGEEFALILPGPPRSGAMTMSRAVLRTLASTAIAHPDSAVAAHVTLSGGITTGIPDPSTTVESLLRHADDAWYTAKSRGRN
uniref:diguanylate cyclase domain-containing protein n=1 Tax=Roseateles sp. TaxID=1971397 RepID=UPI00286B46FD